MKGIRGALVAIAALMPLAQGYSGNQDTINDDWATNHMIEEHHITAFDFKSFFSLHDFDNSGAWTEDEVRLMYGMDHDTNSDVSEQRKEDAIHQVFTIFDPEDTGFIYESDFIDICQQGRRLPDLGFGPGHHGDIEYEYEIHHYEKFHGEDTREEDLTHPEDLEHFRAHDEQQNAEKLAAEYEKMSVVERNIPSKFLKDY